MDQQLLEKITRNERNKTCLTSKTLEINDHLIRYYDDLLPDMYDNNYFEIRREISGEDYERILADKQKRGEKHLKIVGSQASEFLIHKEMEASLLLTMLKEDYSYPERSLKPLTFRNLKDADIRQDLTDLEAKHYADSYGIDFTLRKSNRFYDLAATKDTKEKDTEVKDNGLDYFAAYCGDTIVASCSTFSSDSLVCIDDLLTDRDFRHQGIATALMAHVHHHFKCPMFLHAYDDDTPKDMYRDMGFVTVKTEYEYFASDSIQTRQQ